MSLSLAGNGTVTGFDPVTSGFGALVSVHSDTFVGNFATTSSTFVDVTDFNVTMTPTAAANKIVVCLLVGSADNTVALRNTLLNVSDGSTEILPSYFETTPSAAGRISGATGGVVSAGSTSPRTYQVRIAAGSDTARLVNGTLIVLETKA